MNNIIPPTNPTTDDQNPQQPPQDQGQGQVPGYQPSLIPGGEKGLPLYEPSANDAEIQATPEILSSPEAQKPQPASPPAQKSQDTGQQPAQPADKALPKNVVDKTTSKEKLHKVGPQADTITTLADKEEEEFIEQVEEHHKH